MKPEIYRVIDANFNRSREGLRVCEDIARFILNSKSLSKDLKYQRHRISSILVSSRILPEKLTESRDSRGDVGGKPDSGVEVPRMQVRDIFFANIERVKESLRVLEEFSKLVDIESSAGIHKIRFITYDIEKRAMAKFQAVKSQNKAGI